VQEVTALKNEASRYILTFPMPWNCLTKSEKDFFASWMSVCHHGLQWEDRMIPYSMVERLITMAVIGIEGDDNNKIVVYVKGFKKRE